MTYATTIPGGIPQWKNRFHDDAPSTAYAHTLEALVAGPLNRESEAA